MRLAAPSLHYITEWAVNSGWFVLTLWSIVLKVLYTLKLVLKFIFWFNLRLYNSDEIVTFFEFIFYDA